MDRQMRAYLEDHAHDLMTEVSIAKMVVSGSQYVERAFQHAFDAHQLARSHYPSEGERLERVVRNCLESAHNAKQHFYLLITNKMTADQVRKIELDEMQGEAWLRRVKEELAMMERRDHE